MGWLWSKKVCLNPCYPLLISNSTEGNIWMGVYGSNRVSKLSPNHFPDPSFQELINLS